MLITDSPVWTKMMEYGTSFDEIIRVGEELSDAEMMVAVKLNKTLHKEMKMELMKKKIA
jgi:hypothetical protein